MDAPQRSVSRELHTTSKAPTVRIEPLLLRKSPVVFCVPHSAFRSRKRVAHPAPSPHVVSVQNRISKPEAGTSENGAAAAAAAAVAPTTATAVSLYLLFTVRLRRETRIQKKGRYRVTKQASLCDLSHLSQPQDTRKQTILRFDLSLADCDVHIDIGRRKGKKKGSQTFLFFAERKRSRKDPLRLLFTHTPAT